MDTKTNPIINNESVYTADDNNISYWLLVRIVESFLFPFTDDVKQVSARIILPQVSVPHQSTLFPSFTIGFYWVPVCETHCSA